MQMGGRATEMVPGNAMLDMKKDIHLFQDFEYCHNDNCQYFLKGVVMLSYPINETGLKKKNCQNLKVESG